MTKYLDRTAKMRFEIGGSKMSACLLFSLVFVFVSVGCQKQPPGLLPASDARLPSPIVALATGRDFEWHFTYPGPDATLGTKDDITQPRTLYVPPDSDVELRLQSDDYIYSMTLPRGELKEIAVPDLTFSLKFHTSSDDRWDLMVDPMCGFRAFHDDKMGEIIVEPRSDYAQRYGEIKPQSNSVP